MGFQLVMGVPQFIVGLLKMENPNRTWMIGVAIFQGTSRCHWVVHRYPYDSGVGIDVTGMFHLQQMFVLVM